jgi:PAS domain S-box-containing protein
MANPNVDEQDALHASDAIIAISADAIISIDESQRITRFNRGAEEIFGYAAAEMIGQRIEKLIPARFHSTHEQHVRTFARSPVVARRMGERSLISAVRSTGEEFPAEASISKTRVAGQWLFTVVLRDVSERVRAEQTQRFLAQAGALLAGSLAAERTLESVAELAVRVLGDWCVIFLGSETDAVRRAHATHADPARSAQMLRLCEIPFRTNPGHPVLRCLTSGETVVAVMDDAMLRRMADDAEHYDLLRSLEPRSMLAVALRAREHVVGAICMFFGSGSRVHTDEDIQLAQDLASRAGLALDNARLYEEAQAAIRARDDVLAVVSHDLGNPIAAIRVGTAILQRQLGNGVMNTAAERQIENIRASALQMERLVLDLLDIKRIEAGFLSLNIEAVAVADLLAAAGDVAAASGSTLTFSSEAPDIEFHVLADRDRVLQVFANLLGNAARYTPQGGAISIGAELTESAVEFRVSDTGTGISPEDLRHIFDRFWQARRSGHRGVGLGLAIVKGIVDAHGGRVRVESEPGAGSTFYFTLPVAS